MAKMKDWLIGQSHYNPQMDPNVKAPAGFRGAWLGAGGSPKHVSAQPPVGKNINVAKGVKSFSMLPMPSQVQQTAQDIQSPLLTPKEKVLRFLLRGTNEVASPAEEWRAKGGI